MGCCSHYEDLHLLATGRQLLAAGVVVLTLVLVVGLGVYVARFWAEHQRANLAEKPTETPLQTLES